jgi:hypothetical protein
MDKETIVKRMDRDRKVVIERLRQVALGQPVGRKKKATPRQPWRKLGNHAGNPFFEVQCPESGKTHFYQLCKIKGVWHWRPLNPYGPRRYRVETEPLAEDIVQQIKREKGKGAIEQLLDEFTHDGFDEHDADRTGSGSR